MRVKRDNVCKALKMKSGTWCKFTVKEFAIIIIFLKYLAIRMHSWISYVTGKKEN